MGFVEQLTSPCTSSSVQHKIGILGVVLIVVLVLLRRRNGNKNMPADMDGIHMKTVNIASETDLLLRPHLISQEGKRVAFDEAYVVKSSSHRQVVIHSAEQVREFLRNDAKNHYRPPNLNFGDYFYRLLGQCVGAVNGQEWQTIRSFFDPVYTHDQSLTMLPVFQEGVDRWLTSLNDSLRGGLKRMVVNAPAACQALPLRVIPRTFYGSVYDDAAHDNMVKLSMMHKLVAMNIVLGKWQKYAWFNSLPTASKRILDKYQQQWKEFNMSCLAAAQQTGAKIPAQHVYSGVEQGSMKMENYLQTIDEMIFTNIDITAGVLEFMITKLATLPDFQKELYEEIRTEYSQDHPEAYIPRKDTLIHFLCLESVRLKPAVAFSVPECTTVDKIIGRYKIPAHIPFIVDVLRLNTDATTWGPDSSEFNPHRFKDLSPSEYRYAFVRFGLGSSKCLGKHMADVLMKSAIVTIVSQFRIEPLEKGLGVKEGDMAFIRR